MSRLVGLGANKPFVAPNDKKVKAKIAELEKEIETLTADKEGLVEENETLKAKIAELENTKGKKNKEE